MDITRKRKEKVEAVMETKQWEAQAKMTKDRESGNQKLASISPWRTQKEKKGGGGGSGGNGNGGRRRKCSE